MELNIKNTSSRVLLEKTDNGVILYDISEDNTVASKMVYEIYFKDGISNFHSIANMISDIMETMRIPISETSTNRKMEIVVVKIDPQKPALGEENDDEDDK